MINKPSIIKKISYSLLAIGFIIFTIAGFFYGVRPLSVFSILGIIIIIIGLLIGTIFLRCPHCKKSLPLRGHLGNHCPECGFKFD